MKKILTFFAVVVMALAIPQCVKAYDFSATIPSGQTLYFNYATGGGVTISSPCYNPPYCNNVTLMPTGNLTIPSTVEYNGVTWNIVGIGSYAFNQCTGLINVTIECSGEIGASAFYGCTGITTLYIGDGITSIGNNSFYGCTAMTTMTIGNSCTYIGQNAFQGCTSLHTITLGQLITSIGNQGFYGCNGLASITCYASVPPTTNNTSFTGVSSNSQINVPCGSSSSYSSATGWNQFVNIVEMDALYTVTVNSLNTTMGTVSINECGNTITATANNGYHFVQWNDGNTANPRTLNLTSDATFTALFVPNQYTITGSALSNGTVTGGGTVDYLSNVTLTATPNEGYYFAKWRTRTGSTYDDYSTDNPLTVQVTGDMTFYASFEQITCMVEAPSSNSLMGYTTGGGAVYYGSTVQLQAYANTGYRFISWSDGVLSSSRSIYVTSDITLTAIFEPIPQYVVSVGANSSDMGTANGGGTYYENSTTTLTATPAIGCYFIGWSDGINANPRTVTIDRDTTFMAMFAFTDYVITAQTNNSLRGSVEGADSVHYGETVTLTATPNEHFTFQYWQTSSGATYGDNPLTITVTSSDNYTAYFTAEQHSVVVISDGGGTVSIGNSGNIGNYDYFSQLTLTATANGNNAFLRWNDDNTFNPRTVTITQDTVFTALFLNGTTFLHDTIHDTVYFNHYTHDTTYINNYVHDTLIQYVNQYVHDTAFVNNYVHDTVLMTTIVFDTTIVNIYQYDTILERHYQYDTSIYNRYTYDTTIFNRHQYDTTAINVYDTTINNIYHNDTVFVNNYQHDTTLRYVYDTVYLLRYLTDTVIIRDTIYIGGEGINDIGLLNAKVYTSNGQIVVEGADGNTVMLYDISGRVLATKCDNYSPLRFAVPAAGTYMIKVGNFPARKIVVVR